MYADYDFYTTDFFGDTIPVESFDRCASLASDFIDYFTMGRAANKAELPAVKKCCCALAEQYFDIDAVRKAAAAKVTSDGIIASETVGSHSRSFRNGTEGVQAVTAAEAELANIARRYLMPTGLLYRGVGGCDRCTHRTP